MVVLPKFLDKSVSIIGKTHRNTNLVASKCFKMKKTSLPVDLHCLKTPLLKLANITCFQSGANSRVAVVWFFNFTLKNIDARRLPA